MLGKLFDRTTSSHRIFQLYPSTPAWMGKPNGFNLSYPSKICKRIYWKLYQNIKPIPSSQGWIFWGRSTWSAHTPQKCLNPPIDVWPLPKNSWTPSDKRASK